MRWIKQPLVDKSGTQFTCFTGTKVQVLKPEEHTPAPQYISWHKKTNIKAFTGTNVQILTHLAELRD
jgi:hypothetical protein